MVTPVAILGNFPLRTKTTLKARKKVGLIEEIEDESFRQVDWFAPAKINFYLRVLGKRQDGYHELESLMLPLSIGDRLRFQMIKNSGLSEKPTLFELKVQKQNISRPEDNLVFRAAKIFEKNYCGQKGKFLPQLKITLDKITPIGAGLGGGSSDAAATLLALNHLLNIPFSYQQLYEMGKQLGADVPFFLKAKPCLAKGIGEILRPLTFPKDILFVIVFPDFFVSTKWVYENLDLNLTSDSKDGTIPFPKGFVERKSLSKLLRNDLEVVTLKAYPQLGGIKKELISLGANGSLMSGSGPSIFGYFSGEAAIERAEKAVSFLQKNQKWKVFKAEIIS